MTEPRKPKFDFNKLSQRDKAQVLFQKAVRFHQKQKLNEALQYYTQAIAFDRDFADAYNNMAVILRASGRYDAALVCYQRSLTIRPDHGGTYSNMGNVLNDMDRLEDAINAHRKAIEYNPQELLHLYNAALVLRDAGQCAEAIDLFDQVLKQDPDYRHCRWDRALTHLAAGNFQQGFQEYDARWKLDKSPPRTFDQPRWTGDPQEGRTLFIHREQGFGDIIQFVRFLPQVKERFGGRILLECPPELIRLFQQINGIDDLVPSTQNPPVFDTWVPLLSLGHILGLHADTLDNSPYLQPVSNSRIPVPPARGKGLNIGIAWAGSPTHQNDRRRSTRLENFLPLCGKEDTTLYSLQKGPAVKDLKTTGAQCILIDAAPALTDFADSAALIAQLDLVITIDTSLAHLAGAMGKEVWVLLPYTPDWRWMWNREDSPWYQNLRLFRQDHPGDWDSCFKKLYHALDEKLTA